MWRAHTQTYSTTQNILYHIMSTFFMYFFVVVVFLAVAAKVEFIVYVGQFLVRKSEAKTQCKNFPRAFINIYGIYYIRYAWEQLLF